MDNIELIKDKDPVLYKKCKLVERFTNSGNVVDESRVFALNSSGK